MKHFWKFVLAAAAAAQLFAGEGSLPPDVKGKVDGKLKELQAWSTDAKIVAAVKAYNAAPPAEALAMTNEKWKALSLLDPFVRSYTKNPLAEYLKSKRDDEMSEMFVSGADGNKVAFFAKTTSFCHKDAAKHRVPMTGKTWIGPAEQDESTGQMQVQIALPVLDGSKPIGSIVIGLSLTKLK
ncbi:MAG: PDC sensor domain-containing protein [Acidobacteriia bacterium]|nr:PDC sensor domain-containing protein [Terriglobia bacterium]